MTDTPERERYIMSGTSHSVEEEESTDYPVTVTITNEGSSPVKSKDAHQFYALAMLISNQMSQMLLLLPSCVAKLGWWKATLATAIFGLLSCWTAHIMEFFYFRYYRTPHQHDKNKLVQWDKLLSYSFRNHSELKNLGILAMGFNCLCLLTRSIIQLTYAVSIVYFVNDKIDKRNWTYALASCCILFALIPTLRKRRIFSILSFFTATVAALSIVVASLLHQPVQGVKHSGASSGVHSWAWVSSTIVYALGDSSVSVETLVTIKEWNNQHQFKYVFWGSTAFATVLSLVEALISYWVFGDELSKISPAAQPCALAVLPPSHWRDIASISLLMLQLVAIGHSLHPLFMYLNRVFPVPAREHANCHIWHRMARASVIGFTCIIAAAVPFSGSMEITSLVGAFIVSPAIYIIPAAAHMLYFRYSQHREDVGLSGFALLTSYMIDIIQFGAVLIFVTIMGGVLTSIKKVFLSHNFHRSDFWNKCYLCADFWLSPALAPISAPAPS